MAREMSLYHCTSTCRIAAGQMWQVKRCRSLRIHHVPPVALASDLYAVLPSDPSSTTDVAQLSVEAEGFQ